MILAPILLKNVTRILLLLIYVLLIATASYGVTQFKVHFSQMYFVSEDSHVKSWFDANRKYFNSGGAFTTTYVQDEIGLDFTQPEV